MRFRLEKRREPSRVMQAVTPVAAVLLTMLIGALIFWLIGYDGRKSGVGEYFFTPFSLPTNGPTSRAARRR